MSDPRPVVHVVDDDDAVRDSLALLLRLRGYRPRLFDSGAALLADLGDAPHGCVLLDLVMPGPDGLAVQAALRERGMALPVIMLTAHGDAASARAALKAGAFDFLEKPVDEALLIDTIEAALAVDQRERSTRRRRAEVAARMGRLTPREREVLAHVVNGRQNREIAIALGISPRTVEVYKAKLLDKLQVERLPDLIRLALEADLVPPADQGNP